MTLFSFICSCFVPKSSSQVITDDADVKTTSLKKPKGKSKSQRAPIVVSYFPVGSQPSRL
ncbi:uncharacterized protein LOC120013446 [Tripterygium wilfordii]|uniref:uncharacterized protein LOC120013446 n=1 Tax=Tripterygium wilfordii TaxID=458696 RepID=UPI0018F81B38|nr:uncharacterized protein LOC120013446 [Tripterygium wilfordii]